MVNWFGAASQTGLEPCSRCQYINHNSLFLKKKAKGKLKKDLLRGEPVSPLQVTSSHPPPHNLENVLFS